MSEAIKMKSPDSSKHYTYRDYETWEGRWELIHGVPYNMSPAPSTEHQRIVGELYYALRSFTEGKTCEVFVSPFDIRFSETDDYENDVNTVVQPDISVICNPNQIDEKGGKGAPHLVVEILSPSTALKDRNEKFKLYEKHGVMEYWIVDPIHKTIEIYGLEQQHFNKKEVYGELDILNSFIFNDFTLDLEPLFFRI